MKAGKEVEMLTFEDLKKHPVWKFTRRGPTHVEPVSKIPCTTLSQKIVGTQVRLADGTLVWGMLGNIDTDNPEFTKYFLTLSVKSGRRWFHLARYFDYDRRKRGPTQLAKFLGKTVKKVFPITYDIRGIFRGKSEALKGTIEKEPLQKLTRGEIIAMAVPKV